MGRVDEVREQGARSDPATRPESAGRAASVSASEGPLQDGRPASRRPLVTLRSAEADPDAEPADAPPWEAKLRDYLAKAGLRVTNQRRAIAQAFFESVGHPNIDELYTRIRAQHPRIGQATVYRTLKLLVDSGLAEPSRFGDGTTRYEAHDDDDHHDHLICIDCGFILEFRNDEIERLQDQIAAEHGFGVTDHKMVIYATCKKVPCPNREVPKAGRQPTKNQA